MLSKYKQCISHNILRIGFEVSRIQGFQGLRVTGYEYRVADSFEQLVTCNTKHVTQIHLNPWPLESLNPKKLSFSESIL